MKSKKPKGKNTGKKSRPVRGARIEIKEVATCMLESESRAPCGARGLKFIGMDFVEDHLAVAPRTGRAD